MDVIKEGREVLIRLDAAEAFGLVQQTKRLHDKENLTVTGSVILEMAQMTDTVRSHVSDTDRRVFPVRP